MRDLASILLLLMLRDFSQQMPMLMVFKLWPCAMLSDVQLQHYISAAAIDRALFLERNNPKSKSSSSNQDLNTKEKCWYCAHRVISADGKHLDIGHGKPNDSGPTYPKRFAAKF